jgi:chromate transport protein ChrA
MIIRFEHLLAKPGPTAETYQVVCYLGFQLGGRRGSAMAAASFVLPPMVGMVANLDKCTQSIESS